MPNWLADQVRRGGEYDAMTLIEAARKALPGATARVNETWSTLLGTPKDHPDRAAIQAAHHAAALQHGALLDLAGEE